MCASLRDLLVAPANQLVSAYMKSLAPLFFTTTALITTMQRAFAFVSRQTVRHQPRAGISSSLLRFAEEGQAEVILVGCGAPNRGMGW